MAVVILLGGGGRADSKCPQVLKMVLGKWATQVYDTLDPCSGWLLVFSCYSLEATSLL